MIATSCQPCVVKFINQEANTRDSSGADIVPYNTQQL